MSITKHNVYMRITSRISGVNPIFSDMTPNFVKIGSLAPSSLVMRRVVSV